MDDKYLYDNDNDIVKWLKYDGSNDLIVKFTEKIFCINRKDLDNLNDDLKNVIDKYRI